MKIGEVLRYKRPYSDTPEDIAGYPNFFWKTRTLGMPMVLLEAGINSPGKARSVDGIRVPAVLIRSSPHKVGSDTTPWHDVFRPDLGHARYFGDNKEPGSAPEHKRGNVLLLEQFALHQSSTVEDRMRSAPVVCFESTPIEGRQKGQVRFQGVGLIERIERVAQVHPESRLAFVNYSFDFLIIDLLAENEQFDWRWISDRRNPALSNEQALRFAPTSWKRWISEGRAAYSRIRRAVSRQAIVSRKDQVPLPGSREERVLKEVYAYYHGRKARFEAVGSFVAARILGNAGSAYMPGWITQASADHGIDFVARLDIGSDLARVRLVVLGQAKCEAIDVPTNGNAIARTVARLRRGWIGVYVTTSFFSDSTQQEVIEDQYPIVLIDGLRLAKELVQALSEEGLKDIRVLLQRIDDGYEAALARRSPEEVLLL